jgi:divalent metal cation (Fe/Co/Zn/Cd) transporter
MDASLPEEDLRVIQDVLAEHSGEIRGYHRLRTRRSGATRHIDMHLLFEASRSVHDVHEVSDRVSEEIHRRLPGSVVVIHVEPDEAALTSSG